VIDLELAWTSTDEGKNVRDQLQSKFRAAEAKMQPKIEHFQQLQKEMQEMQHVLSKDAMQKRQFDLVELKGQLENESAGLEQQLKLEEARLTAPLQERFVSVVEGIGRDEGFSLILLRGAPGIMYSREALDITELVVEAFNKKN
jgi:Skp family chaperone for outer membrane proteins